MLVSFNLIILLFVFLCLYGLVVSIKKDKVLAGREKRTLSVGSTNAVKGIAIIGIFISHMSQKIGGGYSIFMYLGSIGVAIFFVLSGYGNYISLMKMEDKTKNYYGWLLKRIVRLIVPFLLAFLFVICVQVFCYGKSYTIEEILLGIVTLTIPPTTTWYIKIQLLLYVIAMVSMLKMRKHFVVAVTVLVAIYVAYSIVLGMAEFWWITTFCFPLGMVFAKKKEILRKYSANRMCIALMAMLLLCGILFAMMLKINFHLGILFYFLLGGTVMLILFVVNFRQRLLEFFGRHSISIYLIHIGLVEACLEITDKELGIVAFMLFTILGSVFAERLSKILMGRLKLIG